MVSAPRTVARRGGHLHVYFTPFVVDTMPLRDRTLAAPGDSRYHILSAWNRSFMVFKGQYSRLQYRDECGDYGSDE